ncbi:GNAT family N-acetyltransferase [Mycobacterium sp. 236(2023)]|uniref:GNAT family N-acetyltransferase n=1 Tax=Mycobacterium sp. 236(2023) TaxID=3038163 RepID=UPI00241519F7|nr:GNAT family N-acetyltransferase [Mycobacterium sp. 236(2023)]MDG4665354.1 GNAT family N-acetyltransferase [Mycobacterium sp. 236(2023)]
MTQIRRAEPADALAVADVHVRAWQVGYRGLLPQEYLDGLDVAARAARYAFDRTLPQGPVTLLALSDGGEVVGLTTIGRCRDVGLADHGEVWSMYVDPDRWGRGFGQLLIGAARQQLYKNGFDRYVLWVLETNARARRFYERDKWRADGARRADTIGGAAITDVRYLRGPD